MIDRDRLLKFCDDDAQLAQAFLDSFKDEAQEALNRMPELAQQERWTELATIAHQLKSHFDYLGVEEMVQHCRKIEHHCDSGMTASVHPLLIELEAKTKLLLREI